MNATPLLSRLLAACAAEKLEVVLIGSAAAALHGAPVTTLDFDFMFRDTPTNMRKLKRVAAALGGMILRSYYPSFAAVPSRARRLWAAGGFHAGDSRGAVV